MPSGCPCLLCPFSVALIPVIHVQPITCLQFWPPADYYYWEPLIALDIHLPIKSSLLPIKEVLSESMEGTGCRREPGFIISFVTVGGALTKDTGCSYQTHVMGHSELLWRHCHKSSTPTLLILTHTLTHP